MIRERTMLVNDPSPSRKWAVVGCRDGRLWVVMNSDSSLEFGYVSALYEVDLNFNQWREISFVDGPCILTDVTVSDEYVYALAIVDTDGDGRWNEDRGKVLRMERSTGEIAELTEAAQHLNDVGSFSHNVPRLSILGDAHLLVENVYEGQDRKMREHFGLIDISRNRLEYSWSYSGDDGAPVSYATKVGDEPVVVFDSCNSLSGRFLDGNPDRIYAYYGNRGMRVVVEDQDSLCLTKVVAFKNENLWLHVYELPDDMTKETAEQLDECDQLEDVGSSRLYEVNLATCNWRKLPLANGAYVLRPLDFAPSPGVVLSETCLYAVVVHKKPNDSINEAPQRLIQWNRATGEMAETWIGDNSEERIIALAVLDDEMLLAMIDFEGEDGGTCRRYDLIDLNTGRTETVLTHESIIQSDPEMLQGGK